MIRSRVRFHYFCALANCLFACSTSSEAGPDAGVDTAWLRDDLIANIGALTTAPRATPTERSAARDFIVGQLDAIGWSPALHSYATGANVYAAIPATTGSTRRMIVGAHFDSASGSPGANDNASGTAVVLGIARYLRDLPVRDAETVIVLFDQEENGLIGSRAYAATLSRDSVFAVLTIDQVSWDADGDRTFEIEKPTAELEQAYQAAADALGATISITTTQGTDHQAFRDRGFPAAGLTEEYVGGDTSPHVHKATDTADTVNADYIELAARLAIAVVTQELSPP